MLGELGRGGAVGAGLLELAEDAARKRRAASGIARTRLLAAARGDWDRLARNVAKLNAAGVPLALGPDVGGASAGGLFGWTEHIELEHMVAAGLTPAQALVAATRTPASILGLDQLGTIAAGKSADFLVLDANPLDDIRNTRRISRVYLRGVEIDRARLSREWTK